MAEAAADPTAAPPLAEREHAATLVLFDVDGTLAVPAQDAEPEMVAQLARLRQRYAVGTVGAGDFAKQQRQLGGHDMRTQFDFVFSENGVHAFRGLEQIHCKSIVEQLGEERWAAFEAELDRVLEGTREEAAALLAVAAPGAVLAERGTFLEKRMCGPCQPPPQPCPRSLPSRTSGRPCRLTPGGVACAGAL